MRPLDRLSERMDERQAKLVLYPPRALHQPGASSAILEVRPSGPPQAPARPYDQEQDDRGLLAWPGWWDRG